MARKISPSEKNVQKIDYKPVSISPGSIFLSASSYAQWFNSETVNYAFESFVTRYSGAKSKEAEMVKEARMVTTLYAVLVYYIYDNKAEFREAVQSSKELSANFSKVKGILDRYEAKASADSFIEHFNGNLPKGSE